MKKIKHADIREESIISHMEYHQERRLCSNKSKKNDKNIREDPKSRTRLHRRRKRQGWAKNRTVLNDQVSAIDPLSSLESLHVSLQKRYQTFPSPFIKELVKVEANISIFIHQYERFKMLPNEYVKEIHKIWGDCQQSQISRRTYSNEEIVSKWRDCKENT